MLPIELVTQNKTLNALQLMLNEGLTQAAACEKVGVSPITFRKWMKEGTEAITELQKLLIDVERDELIEISRSEKTILETLVRQCVEGRPVLTRTGQPVRDADGNILMVFPAPMIMLRVFQELQKIRKGLEEKQGLVPTSSAADSYILKGPTTQTIQPGRSKVTVRMDGGGATVEVSSSPSVIDSQLKDIES